MKVCALTNISHLYTIEPIIPASSSSWAIAVVATCTCLYSCSPSKKNRGGQATSATTFHNF